MKPQGIGKARFGLVRFQVSFLRLVLGITIALIPIRAFGNDPDASEEALFVRRLLEFWKDRETALLKVQIKQFFAKYPQSKFQDSLLVMLGDIYMQEKCYAEALDSYYRIQKKEFQKKTLPNRLACLYYLESYAELMETAEKTGDALYENLDLPENSCKAYYYAFACWQIAKKIPDESKAFIQYQTAKNIFEKLTATSQKIQAQVALAEISMTLGYTQEAAALYLALAEALPEQKEEWLYRAARIQAECDPKEALAAYSLLQQEGGSKSSEASLSKLLLLYELGSYQKILDQKEAFREAALAKQGHLVEFFIGRSHFLLNQYAEAISVLAPLLDLGTTFYQGSSNNDKALLLTLIASAHQIQDTEKLMKWTDIFEEMYPEDPENAKVLYLKALTFKTHQMFAQALRTIESLIERYPAFEKAEAALYERNVILFKMDEWQKSREGFLLFVANFPESPLKRTALRYIPSATLRLLEQAEKQKDSLEELQEQLVNDLQAALNSEGVVEPENKPKYLLKLGKTFYDLKKYNQAQDVMQRFLEQYPNDPSTFQAHLLLAMTCHENGSTLSFIEQAEKVLALKSDLPEKNRLHLNLFSAYLQLPKLAAGQEEDLIEKAAYHLSQAMQAGTLPIHPKNKLWLANYYYDKAKGSNEYELEPLDQNTLQYAHIAIETYEQTLTFEPLSELNPDHLYLENEYYKLSNLLGWMGNHQRRLAILESLLQEYEKHPDWPWKLRSRVLFGKADALRTLGREEQAHKIYKILAKQMKQGDPYAVFASQLNDAKLQYARLSETAKTMDNPHLQEVLNNLKDLQIRKNLGTEPVHLEAALEYVQIRSSLEPPNQQAAQMLFLLQRLKTDFNATDDVWSREYAAQRKALPDKARISQAYLLLIDGHIARLQASLARQSGDLASMQK